MPGDGRLFAVTQQVLRAGIIVTMVLIGMFVLGVAATIFGLSTSRPAARQNRARDGRHDDCR